MDLKDTYNQIADDWAQDHSNDTWWVEGTDKFLSFLPEGGEVLDVGCGAGIKSEYLVAKGFKVTGIDFSENMIEIAKAKVPQADFLVRDIFEPLNLNRKFDGIFAQAVLLHIPKKDIKSVIANLLESLKPEGYFYAAVKGANEDGVEEKNVKEQDYGYEYERFFSFFTADELKSYLIEQGLKIVFEYSKTEYSNWIQIIAKK